MPTLTHKIRLNSTPEPVTYFKQACGTARFVWNWALAEWNRQGQAGAIRTRALSKNSLMRSSTRHFPG